MDLPRLSHDPLVVARGLVGYVNFQTSTAKQILAGSLSTTSSRRATKDFPGFLENATNLAEAVQHIVGSLRVPLSNALAGTEPSGPSSTPESDDLGFVGGIHARIMLGQQYDGLERLWSECAWHDWYVETGGQEDLVQPNNTDLEVWRSIGHHRRTSLQIEMSYYAIQIWRKATPSARVTWSPTRVVKSVSRHARRLKFSLGVVDHSIDHPPSAWCARLIASEQYLDGIFDEPLPAFAGVSVRNLLDAFYTLGPIATLLANDEVVQNGVQTIDDLLSCAPRIHVDDVVTAIAKGLSVTTAHARAIMKVLTFDRSTRDEPWLKPFVPLDGPWVTVILESLDSPNLLWAIDSWLRAGGFLMSTRGKLFEEHIRSNLRTALTLPNMEIVGSSFRFAADKSFEEIDFVARIGSTVLIGEVKCSVFPTEPFDLATYASTLYKGADQAVRKASFVAAHYEEFLAAANFSVSPEGAPNIIPLVISNLPLGSGLPGSQAPVTDTFLLTRFLTDGNYSQFAALHADGTIEKLQEVTFYESPQEAETRILDYLRDPPQISSLREHIAAFPRPMFYFDEEKPASFVATRIEPFERMRAMAKDLS